MMFNKNKTDRNSTLQNSNTQIFSVISNSAVFKGDICTENDLRIDGRVEGNINSKGKVIIGTEGYIKGKIMSTSVEIYGKFLGDVIVSDTVILKTSSYYKGQITTHNMKIETGASFFGSCKMPNDEKIESSFKEKIETSSTETDNKNSDNIIPSTTSSILNIKNE